MIFNASSPIEPFSAAGKRLSGPLPHWILGVALGLMTYGIAFGLRFQEWQSWQDVEFRLGSEMLLATHDAYHWIAGAEGFEFGVGHPMSELLRILALVFGSDPAQLAFWLPPVMASFVALLVFLWAWSMGSMEAGFCAGILASLAPGFLARTLLGYADTDLVTLFLPLLMGLAPACWCMRFLRHPLFLPFQWLHRPIPIAFEAPGHRHASMLSPLWIFLLGGSGLLSAWSEVWHSMFPYLVRYNVGLFALMALFLAKRGEQRTALLAVLCYALPALAGLAGLLFPLTFLVAVIGKVRNFLNTLHRPILIAGFCTLVLILVVDMNVLSIMAHHVQGYLKRSGDPVAVGFAEPLVFPSVAQSIIEIQDLSLSELLAYFHPWTWVGILGTAGFLFVLCARSGVLFLLPLAVLAFLSTKMGGRLGMFGAPVIALGLALPADWLACALGDVRVRGFRCIFLLFCSGVLVVFVCISQYGESVWSFWVGLGNMRYVIAGCVAVLLFMGTGRSQGWKFTRLTDSIGPHFVYRLAAVLVVLVVVGFPLADLVPAMTHGPILNRRHADALRTLRTATPEEAMIWHWWDWGYATHHFAQRHTIADGAAHGGPSLYLPAAVYATSDPRFARQLIKYTAVQENIPGNVFKNLTPEQAAELVTWLNNPQTPLIQADGKQYLVVSFDMLNLGFWISTFGRWNFLTREGSGYAISIVPQALAYRLDTGEVVIKNTGVIVPAASIDIFADGRLDHRNYAAAPEYFPDNAAVKVWQENMERRRNVHFLFNRVTGEKLVIDDRLYKTLMVQLLIADPTDRNFASYFRLIYDNVFCRIYEVL